IFDQKDIKFESGALAAFMGEARGAYGLDAETMVGLGYSNGANLLAAALLLEPELGLKRVALLRPVPVLSDVPAADLRGRKVLIVAGARDAYRDKSAALAEIVCDAGAEVTLEAVDGAHELSEADARVVGEWLRG